MLRYTLTANKIYLNNNMNCIDCKLAKRTIFYAVLTIVLTALCYNFLDKKVTDTIYSSDLFGTGINIFASLFSNLFSPKIWAIVTVLATIACIYKYIKEQQSKNLYILSLSLIVTFFVAGTLKVLLARSRPELWLFDQQFGFHFFSFKSVYNSMPSGHTTFTFAGLLAIANFFKNKRITVIAIIVAAIVGVSRILILDHFASDILISAYIGTFCYLWSKAFVEHRLTD